MQVLDNIGHQDRFRKVTSAGALYDLIAPSKDMVNPIGNFNKVKIISKNRKVEHWLNGEKIVEYVAGSNHVQELISKSKFSKMPLFSSSLIPDTLVSRVIMAKCGTEIFVLENYKAKF